MPPPPEPPEEPLAGGNASGAVVRVGDTVRKPWTEATPTVLAYLHHLRGRGVDAPRPLGRDERGRLVLEYVPGELAMARQPLDDALLRRVGGLVRSIHDASVGFSLPREHPVLLPAAEPDLMCHQDLAPWNLVLDGERLVFIDWDGAGPSSRLWDLAYAAQSFAHLVDGERPAHAACRLAAFVDGYGADTALRRALPDAMTRRCRAMYDLLRRSHESGVEPWGSMYTSGHGAHWAGAAGYVERHSAAWADALAVEPGSSGAPAAPGAPTAPGVPPRAG
ncbi:phosphotransferase [Miniimonas sp. S16]|uniref:phosphotransferase n=1 Tax=Miniimonas sp. S16 TaxID=2171623 RepID=UPI000D527028|nr:phosphotransferase [Miniimonas sp. S16]